MNRPNPGNSNPLPRKGSYGVDAPYLLPVPIIFALINIAAGVANRTWLPFFAVGVILGCMGFGLYASRRGKFLVWAELLDGLELRGDERILDIGCGRGAVLMLAAQRLSTGRATGVDLWRRADQSGNSIDATHQNAVVEGVADRVELHTGDMTQLPFPNASFDVVVSNIAMHNVEGAAGRNKAIDEAVRVLRPGGRLLVADLLGTNQYYERLRDIGMIEVNRRNLGWRVWWSGPWLATRLVSARKPGS